jgi:hypothetical protein
MMVTASNAAMPERHYWTIGISTLMSCDREQTWLQQTPGSRRSWFTNSYSQCRPERRQKKVEAAVRNFAREEFVLKHRYAFVLHTDEPHPHVHLLLKAVSEAGVRLNIKKATLRDWRSEFARNLRELGVVANATERAVRGQSQKAKKDGIYRAGRRGESVYIRDQAKAVAAALSKGNLSMEVGKRHLLKTRGQVENGWQSVANLPIKDGRPDLADEIRRFVERRSPVRTEREIVALQIQRIVRQRRREIDRAR